MGGYRSFCYMFRFSGIVFSLGGEPAYLQAHEGNGPAWDGAMVRPDLMLREEWAVAQKGDAVFQAVTASRHYYVVRVINVPGAPAVYIWRRE